MAKRVPAGSHRRLTQSNLETDYDCEMKKNNMPGYSELRHENQRREGPFVDDRWPAHMQGLNMETHRQHNEEHLQTIKAPRYLLLQHSIFVRSSINCCSKPAEHRLCGLAHDPSLTARLIRPFRDLPRTSTPGHARPLQACSCHGCQDICTLDEQQPFSLAASGLQHFCGLVKI